MVQYIRKHVDSSSHMAGILDNAHVSLRASDTWQARPSSNLRSGMIHVNLKIVDGRGSWKGVFHFQ